ncbi:MAG TPA: helix-turn-helix domain-containing protein [Arenimonas sp.]|uniref:helix-turn-helix domain-containing protein n=1 Tax=Arenimonas sp. TaxID=1872635 RepID=UPI002D803933|nr:helix-turn-helix domain-containing protein [Arenimonas sp.]HEU0153051.1 helix-turn-helix domain-containing protein [Arenimonas sp.]
MSAQVVDLDRLRKSCAQCSLHVLCLPAGIGGDDLQQLDEIVRNKRPLEQGETLFRAGQHLGSLFVAREGAFKTVATNQDGDVQVIGFHLPGELMGLDALGSGHHACEAQALTRATVCEIPLTQLEGVCAKVPGLQHQLLRIIGQGINRDQTHMEMLGRRQAPERLALFLHGLSERYKLLGRPGDQFMLPMSREDIASYLGMVIETVSRTLTKMQEDGIISVRGRQLQILDPARLDAMVHGPAKPAHRAHP